MIPAAVEDGYKAGIAEALLEGDIEHARWRATEWALRRDRFTTDAEDHAGYAARLEYLRR
jgi:hypothetical protein